MAISAIAAIGLVVGLGAGGPDPALELAARRLLAERAAIADEALAALEDALGAPLEASREAAARTAAGGELPGTALASAGEQLLAAEPLADRSRAAVDALNAARRAAIPDARPIGPPTEPGELGAVGAQIAALAPSADAFANRRIRAEAFTSLLAGALDAIEAGDLAEAAALVARARTDHDGLSAWESGLEALPIWLDAAGGLLDATDALVAALRDGDREAAQAAAAAIAAIEPGAVEADRALRIAMSEGAGAVVEGPPVRVAELVGRVADTRAEVELILHAVGR